MAATQTPSKSDNIAKKLLEHVPPHLRDTFTDEQLEAIRDAAADAYEPPRHMIDFRTVIPLYFTRLYLVFLLGKDRRHSEQLGEAYLDRRRKAYKTGRIAFAIVFFGPLVLMLLGLVLVGLYALKTSLGIDLFSDFHATDLLEDADLLEEADVSEE